jgi:hypothetical protein
MKIKLTTSIAIEGRVLKAGAEVFVSNSVGRDLINRHRAASFEAATEAKTIDTEALIEPATKRGRKPKAEVEAEITDAAE